MPRSKSIYETFNEYTKDQIKEAISKLTKYDQEILYKKYGNDLSFTNFQYLTEDEKKSYKAIVLKLKNLLANPQKKPRKRFNSIYKYFSEYSMEQVDEAIAKLPKEYVEILHLKFGEDLKNPVIKKNSLTTNQNAKYNNTIIPKITKLLASMTPQSDIQEQVVEETLQEPNDDIATIINDESTEFDSIEVETPIIQQPIEQPLVNAETPVSSNPTDEIVEEMQNIYSPDKVIPMIPVIESSKSKLTKEDYEIVLGLIKTPLFAEMVKILTPREAMIVSLNLVYSDNPNFSIQDIAKFIGIEPQQVIEITRKALLTYKNEFNKLIDKVIEITTDSPVLIKEK